MQQCYLISEIQLLVRLEMVLLDLQSIKALQKSKLHPKREEIIAERTKLRRQRFEEIAKKEKTIDLGLFTYYFKYSSKSDMYKESSEADAEINKLKVNFIKDGMTNLKKGIETMLKMMRIKWKR